MTGARLTVIDPGPLTLVQDLGRPGYGELGVTRSGAADRGALRLANRLVGNDESAAGLEVLLGGLTLTTDAAVLMALTGAPAPVHSPAGAAAGAAFSLRPGQRLVLGRPSAGVRSYLAVRGGLAVPATLGSRSTDTLAGLGPPVCAAGAHLPVGRTVGSPRPVPAVDVAPVPAPAAGPVTLEATPGPREDWLAPGALDVLAATDWRVSPHSDRVGTRLTGARLRRHTTGELPSEGMVAGSVQVPGSGEPIVFGPDHPPTGGYPVVAVVRDAHLDRLAQLRPGQAVRFRIRPAWR